MTQSISKSFTATGVSTALRLKSGRKITYSISGTFNAAWSIKQTDNNGETYKTVASGSGTAAASGVVDIIDGNVTGAQVDTIVSCDAFTSGTMVTSLVVAEQLSEVRGRVMGMAGAKVGATAGWTASSNGADTMVAALPASQTAATLVIPITGLLIGDTITSFYLTGEIIATGTADTLDASLHSQTAAAGVITDASLGSMTQFVSASANGVFNSANTKTILANEATVTEGVSYYLLLTGTTASSNSLKINSAVVNTAI